MTLLPVPRALALLFLAQTLALVKPTDPGSGSNPDSQPSEPIAPSLKPIDLYIDGKIATPIYDFAYGNGKKSCTYTCKQGLGFKRVLKKNNNIAIWLKGSLCCLCDWCFCWCCCCNSSVDDMESESIGCCKKDCCKNGCGGSSSCDCDCCNPKEYKVIWKAKDDKEFATKVTKDKSGSNKKLIINLLDNTIKTFELSGSFGNKKWKEVVSTSDKKESTGSTSEST